MSIFKKRNPKPMFKVDKKQIDKALVKVADKIVRGQAELSLAPHTGGKIEEFIGDDGQYYFRVRSRNGKIIAQSEGYKQARNCHNGAIALVKVFAQGIRLIKLY